MSKIPRSLPVKYKCGHTEKRDLSGVPPSKRRAAAQSTFWTTKAGKNGDGLVCRKCFTAVQSKDKDQRIRQWMLDIADFEDAHDLPEFRGTERQHSSGLVDSARRDRHTVLVQLLDEETSEYPDQSEAILTAAKTLTWAGWWTNNLGFKIRTKADYGQEEYLEPLLDGAEQEATRSQDREHIENENPYDWDGNQP